MDAGVHRVTDILSAPGRFLIPVYQRPYVWTREGQWEPLWSDILWLLDGYLEQKSRHHFLGAIVLQQLQTQPDELPQREVIDGQQRMTTLQILLAASAASAGEMGVPGVADDLSRLVRNSDSETKHPDDVHKLWPTENDRHAFRLVMTPGGPPADAEDDPSNSIQEAFRFFSDATKAFAISGGVEAESIDSRLRALRDVLTRSLQVVSINLHGEDDAQVIFETLNARGTRLLEIDNVKNALFHRAGQQGANVGSLNEDVWQPELGDKYWRQEVRQGRLTRPRAEMFLNHWLTMMSRNQVEATKLFQAFRTRVLDEDVGKDASELARTLCRDASIMRGFDRVDPGSVAGRFFRSLEGADTTTVYPLTLLLYRSEELSPDRRDRALVAMESYLIRRMLAGLTTKNYNKLFVDLLADVADQIEVADEVIMNGLGSLAAPSSVWPDDKLMSSHLAKHQLYGWIGRGRIEYLLWELELVLRESSKTEQIVEKPPKLSIEHILPQQWEKTWPLEVPSEDAVEYRNSLINVLGNLTLVTGSLNSSLSNSDWTAKRERLKHSLLLLNNPLKASETWDEQAIIDRGAELGQMILVRWPGPEEMIPGFDSGDRTIPIREIWTDHATTDPELIHKILANATDLMKELLADLASSGETKRNYLAIEDSLGWSRGRLASVFGGYSNYAKNYVNGMRPFRIGMSEDGENWMWMDKEQASAVKAQLAPHEQNAG